MGEPGGYPALEYSARQPQQVDGHDFFIWQGSSVAPAENGYDADADMDGKVLAKAKLTLLEEAQTRPEALHGLSPQLSEAFRKGGGIDEMREIVRLLKEAEVPWHYQYVPLRSRANECSASPWSFSNPRKRLMEATSSGANMGCYAS